MSKVVKVVDQTPAPPAVGESAAIMSMIERAARDPSVDITKMERLFEMSEKVRAREAEAAFNTDMSAAQKELIPVARNKRNDQTRSNYADLAALANSAMPIIHKHGFGIICSEFKSDREGHLGIAAELTHSGGHSRRYEFHIPFDGAGLRGNANKTQTHAYGSTVSYGRRYAICCVFNIATADDDGNAASTKPKTEESPLISGEQLKALEAKLKEADVDEKIILEAYKVEYLDQLTVAQQKNALARCDAKLKSIA